MAATNNKLLKKFQDEKIKISNNLQKLKILKFDRVGKKTTFFSTYKWNLSREKTIFDNKLSIFFNSLNCFELQFQAGSINTLFNKIFKFLIFTGTTDFTIKSHLRGPFWILWKMSFLKIALEFKVEYYFASVKWIQKNVSSLKNN